MAIRPSSSQEIAKLVAALSADRAATREAAIARLTIIGARASEPLAGLVADTRAAPQARSAALRVFEASADPRSLDTVLAALDDAEPDIVQAAVAALVPHLRGDKGARAVDRLTAIALDPKQSIPIRTAAIRALLHLEKTSVRPLLKAIKADPSPAIAALAGRDAAAPQPEGDRDVSKILAEAESGQMPKNGETLRHAIAKAGSSLALTALHTLIERIREKERVTPAAERASWTAARAAAHVSLSSRGSRLALYDLRESLERAVQPLPVAVLTALDAIGDASCLEPIAAAYAAASPSGDAWWRNHLAGLFKAIVRRERLTRRHAVIRRIERRWPSATELWSGEPDRSGGPGRFRSRT